MKTLIEKTVVVTNDPEMTEALQKFLGNEVIVLLSQTKKTMEIFIVPIIINEPL